MKKFLAVVGLFLMIASTAQAQDDLGDKVHEAAHNTAEGAKHVAHAVGAGVKTGAHAVGEGVKKGAHAVATAGRRVHHHVFVHCRNGGQAFRRAGACEHAGGVVDPS
jgi:hypothetical protein